ncbi:MAG: hypothetical protein H0U97_10235 [Gammaproteobacteria bacterium]|nr:hypothetical protein [Gammaproteobacteria bacterium]
MDPLIVSALGTALERALAVAEDHLAKASSVKWANVAACIEYLRAAQSAVTGLEDEVDEILIEAKLVARFYWEKNAALYERIDRYLNRDQLRPLLGQAIEGIVSCHKFAEQDSRGFFSGDQKKEAVAEVLRLLGELSGYLASLGSSMSYSRENYASPSGINMPELMQIQALLLPKQAADGADEQRTEVARIAEASQRSRVRRGFPLVAQAARIIQELTVVFSLQRSSG